MNEQEYLKAEDLKENAKLCLCPTCPTYPQGCRGEELYCARGVSHCPIDAKGCLCPGCPVAEKYGLIGDYFCDKLPAGASGEAQRKGAPEEPPGFRETIVGIKDAANVGWTRPAVMGSFRSLPVRLEDLFVVPAQVARFPLNGDEAMDTMVTIGPRASRPLRLPTPVVVSGMSFGAVSKNVRLSIARGAQEGGFGFNSGEGGVLEEELDLAADTMIAQYATGRFGIPDERLKRAAAVEVRFGQGAYPGKGSVLPGKKVTKEVAEVRGIPEGQDSRSPARHPDLRSPEAVRARVAELKALMGGRPVGAKIGCGNVEGDVDVLMDSGVDFIALDGFGGGTGATDLDAREECGIPIVAALPRAVRRLEEGGKRDRVSVIASGGLRSAGQFVKCLALGADAVYVGTAALVAINCQQYRVCDGDKCPTGVTTHSPDLAGKVVPEEGGRRLASFVRLRTAEMANLARIAGRSRLSELDRDDLVSVDRDLARLTGVRWLDGRAQD
jgi:glutamate synthase domain-containing protein 2